MLTLVEYECFKKLTNVPNSGLSGIFSREAQWMKKFFEGAYRIKSWIRLPEEARYDEKSEEKKRGSGMRGCSANRGGSRGYRGGVGGCRCGSSGSGRVGRWEDEDGTRDSLGFRAVDAPIDTHFTAWGGRYQSVVVSPNAVSRGNSRNQELGIGSRHGNGLGTVEIDVRTRGEGKYVRWGDLGWRLRSAVVKDEQTANI